MNTAPLLPRGSAASPCSSHWGRGGTYSTATHETWRVCGQLSGAAAPSNAPVLPVGLDRAAGSVAARSFSAGVKESLTVEPSGIAGKLPLFGPCCAPWKRPSRADGVCYPKGCIAAQHGPERGHKSSGVPDADNQGMGSPSTALNLPLFGGVPAGTNRPSWTLHVARRRGASATPAHLLSAASRRRTEAPNSAGRVGATQPALNLSGMVPDRATPLGACHVATESAGEPVSGRLESASTVFASSVSLTAGAVRPGAFSGVV